MTANQSLGTLKKEFENYYKNVTGTNIALWNFEADSRRPDFVLSNLEGKAQIIEVKKPFHELKNDEMDRIVTCHDCMKSFLNDEQNQEITSMFNDFHITLVCDKLKLAGAQRAAFDGYINGGKLSWISWATFLSRTENFHQDFLFEARRQKDMVLTKGSHNNDS